MPTFHAPSIQDTSGPSADARPREQGAKSLHERWPEPDWAARINTGTAPSTAALLHLLYQGFATGPMRPGAWQIDGPTHVAIYEECVARMRQLFEQATDETVEDLQRKFHALTGVPRDVRDVPIEKLLPFFALGRYGGRTVKSPFAMTHRTTHLSRALPDLGWPQDSCAIKAGICHWKNSTNGAYGVAKFVGTGMQQLVKAVHNKSTAISEAKRLIDEEIERGKRERRSIPKRAKAGDLERSGGVDVRAGAGVTAEQLMQRYRLRSVELDTGLDEAAQQVWLNHAYDALHDLSVATDMPPAWLGLGRLSLALGKSGSSAHFDPELRTIHLSRASGAESLANTWAHGLDNHLAIHTMGVSQAPGAAVYLSGLSWQLPSLKCDEPMKNAIALCMLRITNYMRTGRQDSIETGDKSDFILAAKAIEALKGARKNHWTKEAEMFARAFEATIQDRLASAGVQSPWLARGTLPTDLPEGAAADPFPQGKDRRILGQLIDQLLKAIVAAARSA
jgi:hypothetical protein